MITKISSSKVMLNLLLMTLIHFVCSLSVIHVISLKIIINSNKERGSTMIIATTVTNVVHLIMKQIIAIVFKVMLSFEVICFGYYSLIYCLDSSLMIHQHVEAILSHRNSYFQQKIK